LWIDEAVKALAHGPALATDVFLIRVRLEALGLEGAGDLVDGAPPGGVLGELELGPPRNAEWHGAGSIAAAAAL
jgi:hypothetical protein